jgi:hypothetical protein
LPFPDRSADADTAEISRFPFRKFPNVHGVLDYAGTGHGSRYRHVSFCLPHLITRSASGLDFSKLDVPARWYRCLRFNSNLTTRTARLAARLVRYSLSVGLFHPLLSNGLPAHNQKSKISNWTIRGESTNRRADYSAFRFVQFEIFDF